MVKLGGEGGCAFENRGFFFVFRGLRIRMIWYGRYSCSKQMSSQSKIFLSNMEGIGGRRE